MQDPLEGLKINQPSKVCIFEGRLNYNRVLS